MRIQEQKMFSGQVNFPTGWPPVLGGRTAQLPQLRVVSTRRKENRMCPLLRNALQKSGHKGHISPGSQVLPSERWAFGVGKLRWAQTIQNMQQRARALTRILGSSWGNRWSRKEIDFPDSLPTYPMTFLQQPEEMMVCMRNWIFYIGSVCHHISFANRELRKA